MIFGVSEKYFFLRKRDKSQYLIEKPTTGGFVCYLAYPPTETVHGKTICEERPICGVGGNVTPSNSSSHKPTERINSKSSRK